MVDVRILDFEIKRRLSVASCGRQASFKLAYDGSVVPVHSGTLGRAQRMLPHPQPIGLTNLVQIVDALSYYHTGWRITFSRHSACVN
jgi:hypothetical protein